MMMLKAAAAAATFVISSCHAFQPIPITTNPKVKLRKFISSKKFLTTDDPIPFSPEPDLSQSFTETVYSYYNAGTGDHFYTNNPNEILNGLGYRSEGVAFSDKPIPNNLATFKRYFNPTTGDNFYCTNPAKEALSGYIFEGDLGLVSTVPQTGLVPLYRYFNGRDHFYTTNFGVLGGGKGGYQLEGIEAYVRSQ